MNFPTFEDWVDDQGLDLAEVTTEELLIEYYSEMAQVAEFNREEQREMELFEKEKG